jgi:hypothetical protein
MKMKTIAIVTFALVVSTSFAFAQENQSLSRADTDRTSGSANERRSISSGMSATETFETNKRSEPGDFAATDGLSNGSRAWNPTGQVDPGTSNAPAGNSGGE